MSDEGIPSENGAASTRPARLRRVGRAAICASIAALALAAFPALASAFTSAPIVTSPSATKTGSGFNLGATVYPYGLDTTYRFEYGTTTSYGIEVPMPPASEADAGSAAYPGSVSQEVKNTTLLPNTLYHFRLVAKNTGGSTSSGDQTFMTPPSAPAAPSAVVNSPIKIAAGEYELKGDVNPNKLKTEYHFEFGPSETTYGTNLPEPDEGVGSGEDAVPVSQVVTGLAPNTIYHYRIVAHNSDGTTPSGDKEFKTAPNPPTVVTTPFTETASGFELNGTVNPNGGKTTYHFLFGVTEAYGANIPEPDATVPGTGTSPVAVSQLVTGLPPNVPYHYRLVAENAGGATMGEDQFFMTPPAELIVPEPPVQLFPPAAPPTEPPPANQFTVKPAIAKGTAATLQVNVPGPGTVSASGKQLKTVTAGSSGAGLVTLKLKLTGAGLKALKKAKGHKLTLKVKIVFQPTGGSPGTTSRTVTFKK